MTRVRRIGGPDPPVPDRDRDRGGDRGSSTVEFVVVFALAMTLLLSLVQVVVWYHSRQVATTAARHGVDHVRVLGGSAEAGVAVANEFLDQTGSSLVERSVDGERGVEWSTVTVAGEVARIAPWMPLSVSVTVQAPTERIVP